MKKGNVIAAAGVIAVLNALWLYVYSRLGIEFDTVFDFGAALQMIGLSVIFAAFFIGFLIALAIFALLYVSRSLPRNEAVLVAVLGTAIPALLGTFFVSGAVFLFMMVFYALGGIYMAATPEPGLKGVFQKMRAGWNAQRKVIFIVALGGLLVALLLTQANLPYYQQKVKSSLLNMTASLANAEGLVSREDVRQMVISSELSSEEMHAQLVQSCEASPSCAALEPEVKQPFLENQTQKALLEQEAGREARVDLAYGEMRERFSGNQTRQLAERMLERLPLVNTAMAALPILAGVLAFSAILFFETLFIAPFAALLGLLLKK